MGQSTDTLREKMVSVLLVGILLFFALGISCTTVTNEFSRNQVPTLTNPGVEDENIGEENSEDILSQSEILQPTPTLGIGSNLLNPVDGSILMYIPAGEFEMGNDYGDTDERPVHTVYLDAFYMYQTEVTNAMYALCVEDGVCDPPDGTYYSDPAYNDHPVVNVSWYDSEDYCRWAGGRLPTEAEWEKAARGGLVGAVFPWGNSYPVCTPGAENGAQYNKCDGPTVPVGSFAPNGYGLYDMAGNVWEWVGDWYDEDYYANSPYENPTGPTNSFYRVWRGGSWYFAVGYMSVAYRTFDSPDFSNIVLGFRCVISP